MKNLFRRLGQLLSTDSQRVKDEKIVQLIEKLSSSPQERQMIYSILDLKVLVARDIMIPRMDVQTINADMLQNELPAILRSDSYSRIPVFKNSSDNIIGILHVKEYYLACIQNKREIVSLDNLLSDPYFIPESKNIFSTLREFQSKHLHMAVVLDEYGGFSGILTLEDIIEEIVGDIQDEFDSEEEDITPIDDKTFLIKARTTIEGLSNTLTIPEEYQRDGEIETLAGLLIKNTGYIPKLNQIIKIGNTVYKVVEKRKNSIIKVRATIS